MIFNIKIQHENYDLRFTTDRDIKSSAKICLNTRVFIIRRICIGIVAILLHLPPLGFTPTSILMSPRLIIPVRANTISDLTFLRLSRRLASKPC